MFLGVLSVENTGISLKIISFRNSLHLTVCRQSIFVQQVFHNRAEFGCWAPYQNHPKELTWPLNSALIPNRGGVLIIYDLLYI